MGSSIFKVLFVFSFLISSFCYSGQAVTYTIGTIYKVTPDEYKCGQGMPCRLHFKLNNGGSLELNYIISAPSDIFSLGCTDSNQIYKGLMVSKRKSEFGKIQVPSTCDTFILDVYFDVSEDTHMFFGRDF